MTVGGFSESRSCPRCGYEFCKINFSMLATRRAGRRPSWTPGDLQKPMNFQHFGFTSLAASFRRPDFHSPVAVSPATWPSPTGGNFPQPVLLSPIAISCNLAFSYLHPVAISRRSGPPARLAPSHHLATPPSGQFPADMYATGSQGSSVIQYQ